MGQASYYMKCRFKTDTAADIGMEMLNAFIVEGIRAGDYWQEHRDLERAGQRSVFWAEFKLLFPNVYAYLGGRAGQDCDNALAGYLDFGDAIIELADTLKRDEFDQAVITYVAYNIWHGADWDPFAAYITRMMGAVKVEWNSDEYMGERDYFRTLDV